MYRREVVGNAVYPYLTIQKNQGDHQICIAYGNLRWWIRKSLDTKTPYNRDTIEVIQASILVLQGITFDDQKITAGLGNTWCSNKFTLGQKSTLVPKNHMFKITKFTKLTFSKLHFCTIHIFKITFQKPFFHENLIFKVTFFTKIAFSKYHFSQNSHYFKYQIQAN